MPEPRTLNPMKFFDGNGPFSRTGEEVQKDFTARIEKTSPETEDGDGGPESSSDETEVKSISGPEQLAKAGGEKTEVEDVDAPALNGEVAESGDVPPHDDTPAESADDDTIEL